MADPESAAPEARPWRVWIDTGGTFTDCLARDPEGRIHRVKVLSSGAVRGRVVSLPSPARWTVDLPGGLPSGLLSGCRLRSGLAGGEGRVGDYDPKTGTLALARPPRPGPKSGDPFEIDSGEPAPVLAARLVTGTARGGVFPPLALRLATTRGTNALLERKGAATVLFITRGFADLLEIGTQQRPDLFALAVRKPEPLHQRVVEVDERLDAAGEALVPLRLESLDPALEELRRAGIEAAAVALLHSYRNPQHEALLADHLRARGFRHVSASAELVREIRLLQRAETAVVDAYLSPVIDDYLAGVKRRLEGARLHVMTSAGGLTRATEYRAKDSLLSGPAGGVVGAAAAASRSGVRRLVAFDMGGTSTDVSRFDGEFDYRFETRVGGARLLAPTLAIETVAAGGGSICRLEGDRLRVGPESAGARPGPACYGGGGPLCLTDVNLLLGRLDPVRFGIPVDPSAAAAAADGVLARLGGDSQRERVLAGLLRIANERMAEAVKTISVGEGYDPGEYTLVAFGGAGPQHACALAGLLGMAEVLVPADAGLLSALGLGAARIERFAERQVLRPLFETEARLAAWLDELAGSARREVEAEGVDGSSIAIRMRRVELRLQGQDSSLAIEFDPEESPAARFERAYRAQYGYPPPEREIEVVALRVIASSQPPAAGAERRPPRDGEARPDGAVRAWFGDRWRQAEVFERSRMEAGARLRGPALVVESHTATVVEPGWEGWIDGALGLRLKRREPSDA